MGGAVKILLLGAVFLLAGSPASARQFAVQLQFGDDSGANERLAKKIMRILGTSELTVGQYSSSDQVDANTKNPFGSRSTYHSYTWSYCMRWVTTTLCERWLDPYVSGHGIGQGGDQSPLETGIAGMWAGLKRDIDASQVGTGAMQYAIWNVEGGRGNRPVLRNGTDGIARRNTLDTPALSRWELIEDAQNLANEVGRKTADLAILETFSGEERNGKVMPNMESLRAMAASWTRVLRNRLLANVGEARAAQPGIEFELGEDRPTCEAYLAGVQTFEQSEQTPGAIPLPLRDLETFTIQDPQQRYELCKQMTDISVYAATPSVRGGQLSEGVPEEAPYDAVVSAANVAMIDYVGYDPNRMTGAAGISFSEADISNEVTDYEVGGQTFTRYMASNMRQINSYNNALRDAAAGMRAAAARSPNIKDNSAQIESFQIAKESRNLMQINGLTDGMKEDILKDTSIQGTPIYETTGVFTSDPDDESIEKSPSRLTITTLGN